MEMQVIQGFKIDNKSLVSVKKMQHIYEICYCEHRNTELEKRYNDMQTYYTDLVAKFYSLSQPWYDSMFREFFFEGATEEEINAFLFDSNAYANEEYTTLKDRNDAIELEFNGISNPKFGPEVPELYAEFVANKERCYHKCIRSKVAKRHEILLAMQSEKAE